MIKEYLNQPYPLHGNRWKMIITISTFVAIFMLIFQPFGLTNYHGSNKSVVFTGYGLVTFLVLSINLFLLPLFFKKWFDSNKWTVIKQILWLSWIIFTIGIANYFYSSVVFSVFEGLQGFLIFQLFTLTVGIIPIVIVTIINQNMQLSYNLKEANDFNSKIGTKNDSLDKGHIICLIADNEKDKLELELSGLQYIESVGNYIRVYFFRENICENTVMRSSLKRIEKQLSEYTSIVKSHRAFLVNINQIIQVKGNSQGLRLALKNSDVKIPVSRNYSKDLKDKINSR